MISAVTGQPPRTGSVSVLTPLAGSAEVVTARLVADPHGWLPLPAIPLGGGAWRVLLHAGPVARSTRCRVGRPVSDTTATWRPVHWEPAPEGGSAAILLPTLHGELGLLLGAAPTLFLTGTYRPPGGGLGGRLDSGGLRRVAEATARRFLDELAHRLSEPDGHPSAS